MRTIPITQFMYPDGETRTLMCDVSNDVASTYEEVMAPLGVRITAECFRHTSIVSLCLEEPELGDFACVSAENSFEKPGLMIEALERMIRKFDLEEFDSWRTSFGSEEKIIEELVQRFDDLIFCNMNGDVPDQVIKDCEDVLKRYRAKHQQLKDQE